MGRKHLKRLAAKYAVAKKAARFAIKPVPGPHPAGRAVPLAAALAALGVVRTRREAKKALASRGITVDGRCTTDERRPIGLEDVLGVGTRFWRATLDKKGRIALVEIDAAESKTKTCRVEKKTRVRSGVQLTLHDGRTLLNFDAAVGDCVVISLPEGKPLARIPREVGTRCLITGGPSTGLFGQIVGFTETGEVRCAIDEKTVTVQKRNVFPIK